MRDASPIGSGINGGSKRPSIRHAVRKAVLLPTSVALPLIILVFVTLEWRSSHGEAQQRLRTMTEMVALTTGATLAFGNAEDAARTLAVLNADPAVRGAALYDAKGSRFASYRSPEAQRPEPLVPLPDGLYRRPGALALFHPVLHQGKRYGTLYVRLDLTPVFVQMRGYVVSAVLVLAGALLTALLIGRIFERGISRPLLALAATAKTVASKKNYSVRASRQESLELAVLADAFNHMLDETQKSHVQLANEVAATHRAERRVSTILASITDAYVGFDRSWRYIHVSDHAEEMLGMKREALLGRVVWEAMPDLAGSEFQHHLQRVMDTGLARRFEYSFPGSNRWYEHRAYVSDDGVALFFTDVTERKQGEEARRRWEFIFSHAGWAVAAVDPRTDQIIVANPAFAAMHGYQLEEITGRPLADLFAPGSRAEMPLHAAVASERGDYVYESVHQRKDGSTISVITHVSVFRDATGSVLFRAATFQDITERKRAEEALRASEEQMRLVTDATPALISYVDAGYRYRFANQQYETWFGLPPQQIVGHTLAEVLGEEAFARLRRYVDRALGGEHTQFEIEVPYLDGTSRWIHANYIPHRNRSGAVVGLVVLVIDLSERKRMEESLAAARAELERHNQVLEMTVQERTARLSETVEEMEAFSYSIAHDLRAPLRSMQGYSRMLIEDHAHTLDDEAMSFLRRIIAAASRMDRLIQDVLNYSKVVRAELPLETIDLDRVVDDIINTHAYLQSPHASVQVKGPLAKVQGNAAALTQVVANLLGNAVKFVKPGTRPEVRVWTDEPSGGLPEGDDGGGQRWVRLWIEDNGIGIPEGSRHRLFAMFQRLNRPETYEGSGMGLAIVRKAVERMGGTLGVESEEGKGSRFWVQLKAYTHERAPDPVGQR